MIKLKSQKNIKEYDKRKSHICSKIHVIYISSNVRQPAAKTFTTLHYTSIHLLTFHFLPFKTHFTTLSFSLTPFKFPTDPFHLTSLHFTSLHFTALLDDFNYTSIRLISPRL
jgi:hypothetical protein